MNNRQSLSISEAIAQIEDRAHYVSAPGGPNEVRYFSISEAALREALAVVLSREPSQEQQRELMETAEERKDGYVREWLKDPEFRAALQRVPRRHKSRLPDPDPEAPEHCIPGPGCRHQHGR